MLVITNFLNIGCINQITKILFQESQRTVKNNAWKGLQLEMRQLHYYKITFVS